ncbi:uncharacterized protein L3040_002985 [Drepanopeziza brunnea f. sp. 'multigermtubi']|uniref:RNA polymerase II holoenzyme cyclin-like subunit n=1 Tax=Marssonina brunnea f. sp. multigermtubi (strain MB_m1) TaxID=1072389 RepID=K1WWY3_MARBU|nr:cyclin [Drepanopeziza brunnea f. sp. 'multigermtubi' MB_m1]EKD13183.1 cyclin [Drepanopeziza brunnea f. sp. 'multigermtubi' MB_m1]KAJ5047143.1 hypothetical protein L3040_002985 [Drepanopeziza brunnea f. sp. 'multigermtubi']
MTTVEPYRPPQHKFPSGAPSSRARTHPASTSNSTISQNIPPAVPSPPRLSRNSPPGNLSRTATKQPFNKIRQDYREGRDPMAVLDPEEGYSQWLFSAEELQATPSMCDGLDPAEERCRRAKGVNFIIQTGILLKLPQMTIGVASIFFHRFYMRKSMVEKKGGLHHYSLAATALFLATKTEECCRKTKEIVIAVAKVAQKNAALIIDEQSKEYWRWRDSMLLYEELMLEVLTFDLVVQTPYSLLISALKHYNFEDNKHIRNVAWAFVNDCGMTMVCLAMPPRDIAVAALYFAVQFHWETIPDDEETGQPWWVVLGGKSDRIVRAVGFMTEFWRENPLRKPETPYAGYTSSSEDLDRTRKRAGSEVSSIISPPSVNGDTQSHHNSSPKVKEEEPALKREAEDNGEGSVSSSKRKETDASFEEGEEIDEPAAKRAKTEEPGEEDESGDTAEPGEVDDAPGS